MPVTHWHVPLIRIWLVILQINSHLLLDVFNSKPVTHTEQVSILMHAAQLEKHPMQDKDALL